MQMQANIDVAALVERVAELEARVAALEAPARGARTRGASGGAGGGGQFDDVAWIQPYEAVELEVSETWIELHEPSARPQLQRLVRQVVEAEGPITDRLVLDRVRRAWGLRRAGGRVQEAFDQAVRQLLARGLVERDGDALVAPGVTLDAVRVPTEEEASRRGAEDVPMPELVLALTRVARVLGGAGEDDVTMHVAKLFGWTRRGGAIQERLEVALAAAEEQGAVERSGGQVRAAAAR